MRTESFDQYNAGDTGWTMATSQWRPDDTGQLVVIADDAITGPRSLSLRKGLGEGNARLILDFPNGGNKGYVACSMRNPGGFNLPFQSVGFWFENGSISIRGGGNGWIVSANLFIGDDDFQSDSFFIDPPDFGPGISARDFDGTFCVDWSSGFIDVCVLGSDGFLRASRKAMGTEYHGSDWFSKFGNVVGVFVGNEDRIVSEPRPEWEVGIIDNIVCDIGFDLPTVPFGALAVDFLPTAPETVSAEIYSQNGDYSFGWEIMARTGPGPNDMIRTNVTDQGAAFALAALPEYSELLLLSASVVTRANATEGEAIWPFISQGANVSGAWREVQTYGTFIYNRHTSDPINGGPWGTVADFISGNFGMGFSLPA